MCQASSHLSLPVSSLQVSLFAMHRTHRPTTSSVDPRKAALSNLSTASWFLRLLLRGSFGGSCEPFRRGMSLVLVLARSGLVGGETTTCEYVVQQSPAPIKKITLPVHLSIRCELYNIHQSSLMAQLHPYRYRFCWPCYHLLSVVPCNGKKSALLKRIQLRFQIAQSLSHSNE